MTQPFLPLTSATWIEVKDGNLSGRSLYHRHYSHRVYRDGRDPALFVGPGQKLVLLSPDALAVFVWRRFIDKSGQTGINCAIFRNESPRKSSVLIQAADELAWERWPDEPRHYTYVNPIRVRSTNPGFCFLVAGWNICGISKDKDLRILEIRRPAP
jgi:hypothetical protein